MRARNLKPSFYLNYDLAQVEPLGRILFTGLWCMADRKGRLEDIPQKIKVCILPYDSCDVEKLLQDLVEKQFVMRYAINKKHYIQITNFEKHQYPHVKEQESTIPAPDKHHTRTVLKRLNPPSPIPHPPSPVLVSASRHPAPKAFQEQREYRIPEPKDDPLGAVVMYYKAVRKAVPYNDRLWDKQHFSRASKSAKALLEICGSYEAAKACLDQFATDMDTAGRSWTLETVVKWAHEWKGKHGGKDYGATNSASFFNAVAKQRTARKFAELRKVSTAGQVLDGVRNLQRLQIESETDNRTTGNADEDTLESVREETLEAETDRGQKS